LYVVLKQVGYPLFKLESRQVDDVCVPAYRLGEPAAELRLRPEMFVVGHVPSAVQFANKLVERNGGVVFEVEAMFGPLRFLPLLFAPVVVP
jgi:hypothetical protein